MAGKRGRSGRKPKPDAIKDLHGSRKPRGDSSQFPSGIPDMPSNLGSIAEAVWRQTIERLERVPGLLCEVDAGALIVYCDAWQTYYDAAAELKQAGTLHIGGKPHPLVSIQRAASEQILRIGSQFGMSPSARSSLRLEAPKPGVDGADGVLRLLKMRGA